MSDKTKNDGDGGEGNSERREKRLDFLLKQTEMFSHFLSSTGTKPKKTRGAGASSLVSPSKSSLSDSNE